MVELKHTKIYRGGITARKRLDYETDQCSVGRVEIGLIDTLDLRFYLASKGGGTTEVCVEIGKGDFEALLREMMEVEGHTTVALMANTVAAYCQSVVQDLQEIR